MQREDLDLVYDVNVKEKALEFSAAGHESLLEQVVPGKTILVSRSNDEDFLKNPGFIRLITSKEQNGSMAVLQTKTLSVFDIVRGSINPATDRPEGVIPRKGAAPQAGGVRLRRKLGDYEPMKIPLDYKKDVYDQIGKFKSDDGKTEVSYKTPDGVSHVEKKTWLKGLRRATRSAFRGSRV